MEQMYFSLGIINYTSIIIPVYTGIDIPPYVYRGYNTIPTIPHKQERKILNL